MARKARGKRAASDAGAISVRGKVANGEGSLYQEPNGRWRATYRVPGDPRRYKVSGRTREEAFGAVFLSRSRWFAPATHSARFYREYFRPAAEHVVEKDRRRWLVVYRGVEFYVHLDRLTNPASDGYFVEVKSRTWSRRDAQDKAAVISELLALFGTSPDDTITDGYVELAAGR